MKLKEILYLLGFKPKPQKYGYKVNSFELDDYGTIEYAQWLHPRESAKVVNNKLVSELTAFLNPGDFCIDIGAHSGDSAIPIALAVGAEGCVVALEPNSYIYPVLEKNSQLNRDKTNIIPIQAAATEEDGKITFEYSDSGFCNGGRHENISKWKHGHAFNLEVDGIDLSKKLQSEHPEKLEKLRFIKVDTEGYDLYVIQSLKDIIDQYQPYVKTEIFKLTDEKYRTELYNFFLERKYTIYKVNDDEDLKGEVLSLADINNWKHYDIFCQPPT
ncbi:MAG: FkbM family methyltransferase [Planctomycetes bacterium]|nr:FkbM family methyltransferase [Planctomycetota bacterium]